jgi:hypothetical protein
LATHKSTFAFILALISISKSKHEGIADSAANFAPGLDRMNVQAMLRAKSNASSDRHPDGSLLAVAQARFLRYSAPQITGGI